LEFALNKFVLKISIVVTVETTKKLKYENKKMVGTNQVIKDNLIEMK
jgi:hypothetical protein